MLKLVVFDLDGTLAAIGKGSDDETVKGLKELQRRGVALAISSGKPTFYLCGYCRQLQIEQPILIGENGAVMQIGFDLPPKYYETVLMRKETRRRFNELKERLDDEMPFSIWYQPNEIGLTCFFKTEEQCRQLRIFFQKEIDPKEELVVYEHADSFDVTPRGIDKKSSLLRLMEILNLTSSEVAAVGNGVNDYPMFEAVGYSVAIGKHDPSCATVLVDGIHEALSLLLEKINETGFSQKSALDAKTLGI